eukprot:m.117866 g.117866  ORF g.117866 m.117866 type:complete len:669 (+) comp15554_c0_seq1:170-2176(+)
MSAQAWAWFRDTFKSTKVLLAPMTGASDVSWRALCRRYGIQAVFTPMLYAQHLVEQPLYFQDNIESQPTDGPLIVQLCVNDASTLVEAIEKLRPRCQGIDLNLAWSSKRAAAGPYGAHLLEDTERVLNLVQAGVSTGMPITCKMRIHADISRTVALAKRLEAAGLSMLTIEGRRQDQLHETRGVADWTAVKVVRENVKIPVVAVGDVVNYMDVEQCLSVTGASAVMCGETLLHNPTLLTQQHPHVCQVAREYVSILCSMERLPETSRKHLHQLLHLALLDKPNLMSDLSRSATIKQFNEVIDQLNKALPISASQSFEASEHQYHDASTGLTVYPTWRCQASYRRLAALDPADQRYPGDCPAALGQAWWKLLHQAGYVPDNYADLDAARDESLSKANLKKSDRMARLKLKRRHKDAAQAQRRKAAVASGELAVDRVAEAKRMKRQAKREARERVEAAAKPDSGALRVAVDMSLHEAMSGKEMGKLADQVRRLYGVNSVAKSPAHVYLTGLLPGGPLDRELHRRNSGFDKYVVTRTSQPHHQVFDTNELVFLTPDSPNPLLQLDTSKVYVMGGLVDEHIIKDFTLERAQHVKIATARLPIPEMSQAEKTYAPVLSINQVFEALLKLQDTKDWHQALAAAVPVRKGFRLLSSDEAQARVQELEQQIASADT